MVIMDSYYSSDRLLEVWKTIDQLHLSYLEMEESPEKLEHRMKLEDCIREFLCTAAHHQKFCYQETADVLYRSASSKNDFSGYKAATGWNAIQLYAGNLLSQPWRKEYKQIKIYCGFFKHQIEANLVGAEMMFEAMGYKYYSNEVLMMDGPICPDRVANVSKDCLIAYVECQILKAVWEDISPVFNISWIDVLEFRKNHICSPEQSIRALTYQFHQKQYHEHTRSYSHGSDPLGREMQNVPPLLPSNHSFPPLSGHSHLPASVPVSNSPQYIYGTNGGCCPNNFSSYAHVASHNNYFVPLPCPSYAKTPYSNGYYCSNGYVPQPHPVYGATVPTAQLIELESHNGGSYDIPDGRSRLNRITTPPPDFKNTEPSAKKTNERSSTQPGAEAELEDWDYVYRNLESQGYSKDLGERGDILSPSAYNEKRKEQPNRRTKPTNLDEAMHSLMVADRPLKIAEALEKYDKTDKRKEPPKSAPEPKPSNSSSYENLSETRKANPKSSKTKTLPLKEKNVLSVASYETKTLEPPKKKKEVEKWECQTCTYHNDPSKNICDMCSKSRVIVEQQIEIGGSQCPQCTLVNPKEAKTCQACSTSLKDSPTYI